MQRILSYAETLGLTRLPEVLGSVAEEATRAELSYSGFLEKLLEGHRS